MQLIRCKMCGGEIQVTDNQNYGTCSSCGSVMTLPKADDERIINLFNRANHFRRLNEFDRAIVVYENILNIDNTIAEAHWCMVLCRFGIEYIEDPKSHKMVPTCHRTQFDSILSDADYLAALDYSPDNYTHYLYEQEASEISEIQKSTLKVSKKTEPYDIFICYKEKSEAGTRTKDSIKAQEIYYKLVDAGYRVFFSRISLEHKMGSEYEPYIFAALNSAKVMLVIGTKPEHFNSVWVKNEWSRFLALAKKDKNRLLIPCYDNMEPYDLSEELSLYQGRDMHKIGFIYDLVCSIESVLGKEEKQTVNFQKEDRTQGESPTKESLYKRACIFLEDNNFIQADEYFDKVLDIDPEYSKAYMGKLFALLKCKDERKIILTDIGTYKLFCQLSMNPYDIIDSGRRSLQKEVNLNILNDFEELIKNLSEYKPDEYKPEFSFHTLFSRSYQYADEDLKKVYNSYIEDAQKAAAKECDRLKTEVIEVYDDLKRKEVTIKELREKEELERQNYLAQQQRMIEEQRYEKYRLACEELRVTKSFFGLKFVQKVFRELGNYQDSQKLVKTAGDLAIKRLKHRAMITITFIISIFIMFNLYYFYLKPSYQYKNAQQLVLSGNYAEASFTFLELGDFKDSQEMYMESKYLRAKELLELKKYSDADSAFSKLGDYKDSKDLVIECKYQKAKLLFNQNKYELAIELFKPLKDYKDSIDFVLECRYQVAKQSLTEDGYENSKSIFLSLGDYKDSSTIFLDFAKGIYEKAVNLYNLGNYKDAYRIFMKIKSYEDSGEKAQICLFNVMKKHAKSISACSDKAIGLKADGTVVATGQYSSDRFNVENWTDIVSVAAGKEFVVGLKKDGTVVVSAKNGKNFIEVEKWKDIIAIEASETHIVGLKIDGTVLAVMSDGTKEEGVAKWKDIISIGVKYNRIIGLKENGVFCEVGFSYTYMKITKYEDTDTIGDIKADKVFVGGDGVYFMDKDGGVYLTYTNEDELANTFLKDWNNITSLAVGDYHTLALKSNGTVIADGYNSDDNECDVEYWRDIVSVTAGFSSSIGLKSNGELVFAGRDIIYKDDVEQWKDNFMVYDN